MNAPFSAKVRTVLYRAPRVTVGFKKTNKIFLCSFTVSFVTLTSLLFSCIFSVLEKHFKSVNLLHLGCVDVF